MRALALCLGIGILLTTACGGSSSSTAAGGTAAGGVAAGGIAAGGIAAGGVTAAGGNTGSTTPSTGTLTGSCANLTCINDLIPLLSGCNPSGTCTQASTMTATSIVATECYFNGVKTSTSMDMSSATAPITMQYKNGSGVCYSFVINGGLSGSNMSIAIENPAGATVATIALDSTANTETVTCPNGVSGVIDDTCGSTADTGAGLASSGSSATCTTGACAY